MKSIKIFFLFLLVGYTSIGHAQTIQPKSSVTKSKAPKFVVSIGGVKDSAFISKQMAESIIGIPLKIVDAKNISYIISSYQFLYKKIVVSEDEATGKPYNTTSIKSARFKASPLPMLWLDVVKENLRPTEELMFFDVIVKDAKGNNYYAPNLKITIK